MSCPRRRGRPRNATTRWICTSSSRCVASGYWSRAAPACGPAGAGPGRSSCIGATASGSGGRVCVVAIQEVEVGDIDSSAILVLVGRVAVEPAVGVVPVGVGSADGRGIGEA